METGEPPIVFPPVAVLDNPPPAVRGRKWEYAPKLHPANEDIKVEVRSGPTDMVAANNALTWTPPDTETAVSVPVVLTLKSKNAPPRPHFFAVRVLDEEPPVPKVIPVSER